jgi:hypothetical protein
LLTQMVGQRPDIHTYTGDCNHVLLKEVFPQLDMKITVAGCVCWILTGSI